MSTPRAAPLRILVIEDHPIVRLGIRQMVSAERDWTICGELDSAEGALERVASLKPDVALVDLSLGGTSGLELLRQIHALDPQLPVLVLSMHDEVLFAERALRAGARGYIMKQEAVSGLVSAIRQIASGNVYVSERVAQQVLGAIGRGAPAPGGRLGGLTDRELEVFELVGHGVSTAKIAEQLGVSVKTIETYRSNIKNKLRLRDASELVRYAASWVERI